MCLAIPGRILNVEDVNGSRVGRVEFGGIVRTACLDMVPEAGVDDYVLVHVGYAISQIDAEQAQRDLETLRSLALEEELGPEGA